MKRLLIATIIIFSASLSLSAQSYIRVNAGYAFPLNSDLIGEETKTYDDNAGDVSGTAKGVYGSYGAGYSFQIAYGNSIKGGPVGFDLEVGYVLGTEYKTESLYELTGSPTQYTTEKSSANSYQFSPSLTFSSMSGKFRPYTRVGPLLSLTTMNFEAKSTDGPGFLTDLTEGYEFKGGFGLGVKGALGLNFLPQKNFQFFIEVNFTSMSYSPTEGEQIKYLVDGVDMLGSLTSEQRKILFEKDYKFSNSSSQNIQPRETYSMGSVGIQAGLKIGLSKPEIR